MCTIPPCAKITTTTNEEEELNKDHEEMQFEIPHPSIEKDPKQFHKTLNNEQMKKLAVISLTLECNEQLNVCVSAMNREESPTNWGAGNIESLIVIFMYLHTLLIESREMVEEENMIETFITPSRGTVNDDAVKDPNKCSVLHRCILALATGTVLGNEPNMNTSFRNERLASLTASEIIRTLRGKKPGQLKNFMSRQLVAHNVPKAIWRMMTKIGIAPGIETLRRRTIKEVHEALMKKFQHLDPHDIWLLLYDNIGFRVQMGYQQHTALQWVRIPKDDVIQWRGIYPIEGETMDSIPFGAGHLLAGKTYRQLRERKLWLDIRDDTAFDQVMGIEDSDIERLATSTISTIHQLLEVFEQLPSLDEAREHVKHDKYWEKNTRQRAVQSLPVIYQVKESCHQIL